MISQMAVRVTVLHNKKVPQGTVCLFDQINLRLSKVSMVLGS